MGWQRRAFNLGWWRTEGIDLRRIDRLLVREDGLGGDGSLAPNFTDF